MTTDTLTTTARPWAPAIATMLGSAILVSSEFLPAGVLPLIAADLGTSEGTAGLTVAATAVAGILTAPTIASLIPRADRRTVLTSLLLLGALANLLAALATSLPVLLGARLILGVALAGFWALAFGAGFQATGGRATRVTTLLSLGVSLATVIGVPVSSLAADLLGWRTTVGIAAVLAAAVALVVWLAFPPVPAAPGAGLHMLRSALRSRPLILALLVLGLVILGNFAAYPYIRLNIERVAPDHTAVLLMGWGVGAVAGTLIAGRLASRLKVLAVLAPLLVAGSLTLLATTESTPVLAIATILWGVGFNMIPQTTLLWVTRTVPAQAEAASSLQVTVFQTGIAAGSAGGGVVLDALGVSPLFLLAAAFLLAGGLGFALLRAPAEA